MPRSDAPSRLCKLWVVGFKSLRARQELELTPVTVLAGANSAGKSSIIQPFLVLKQTLNSPVGRDVFRLDGPNVRFSRAEQMFSSSPGTQATSRKLTLGVSLTSGEEVEAEVTYTKSRGLTVNRNVVTRSGRKQTIEPGSDLRRALQAATKADDKLVRNLITQENVNIELKYHAVFMEVVATSGFVTLSGFGVPASIPEAIKQAIHVPGLRGNPEREYAVASLLDTNYPGTFEKYTASTISNWQAAKDGRLTQLMEQLAGLKLTWKIEARKLDDTRIELRVGRLQHPRQGGARDVVSVADVGLGISQVLPVLVALLAASPGQMVIIEQPEIHLHPKAQHALCEPIIEASRRGVLVIVETHSSILLLALQTAAAESRVQPGHISVCWAERDRAGWTSLTQAKLDKHGSFGDWPADFDDTELSAQTRFLNASTS